MAKAEPLNEGVSSAARPSRSGGMTMPLCGLCGEPIERGNVVQATMDPDGSGQVVRAHLRCWRERDMVQRVMSRSSDR